MRSENKLHFRSASSSIQWLLFPDWQAESMWSKLSPPGNVRLSVIHFLKLKVAFNDDKFNFNTWYNISVNVPLQLDYSINVLSEQFHISKEVLNDSDWQLPLRLCPWLFLSSWLDFDLLLSSDGSESSFSVTIKTVQFIIFFKYNTLKKVKYSHHFCIISSP